MAFFMSIVKKRGRIIALGAFIFCSLILISQKVEAATIYQQTTDNSVTLTQNQDVGSFTTDGSTHLLNATSTLQAQVVALGSFCVGSPAMYFSLWTGPSQTGSIIATADPIAPTSGFTDILTTWSAGGGTLSANTTYYVNMTSQCSGSDYRVHANGSNKFFGFITDAGGATIPDTSTHIVDFTPEDQSTSGTAVTFSFHAYINPLDIGGTYEIQFILHNLDQNVFLLSGLSPSDIYLLNGVFATSSGDYYFSTTTPIGEGNYTLEASLTQYVGWGWASIANPLSSVNQQLYHRFIVCDTLDPTCKGTVIGNLQQNGYDILAGATGYGTGTTTAAYTLQTCSPISSNAATAFLNTNFDPIKCSLALLTPDPVQLNISLTSLRDDTLKHIPWGYFTRLVSIFNATSSASLPSFTITLPVATGTTMDVISVDSGDILAGGSALLASTTDPISHSNIRDVAEPIVQLSLALSILFTIVADLIGSHKHSQGGTASTKGGKDV